MRLLCTALAAVLVLATGCGDDEKPVSDPTPTPSATSTSTEPPPTSEPVEATPLDWQPTGQSVDERVIVGERWTAISTETNVRFESATGAADVAMPTSRSGSVFAVLLDGDTAVVSYAYGGESIVGTGYRLDLAAGKRTKIVTPEPANGGDWALIDDSLYYPALDENQDACLATLAVTDGNGEEGWCPPELVGIAELEANEHGVAAMLFDYGSDISCRTLTLLDQAGVPQPVEGPAECKGWDIAATGTGIIWSEVPRPKRQESAVFHALVDGAARELGAGTTGTLTTCGGDTFYVSDPLRQSDPARLMRWDGTTLSVAYESKSKGNAFLGTPECADGIITISSYGEDGDEQVSANVA
ncbi:MAG: hypothetical protein ABIR39_13690 [Nocardioides sp.]|uniref:hypothetical protein n=1 Tax=Nocardioides sp. TaxID=35761 RepID=UPI0032650FD3